MKPAFVAALVAGLLFVNCGYVATQGYYFLSYKHHGKKVSDLLADTTLTSEDRRFLQLTQEIRAFARDRIGLHTDDNFSTYVPIDQNYLLDVVSGCRPDTFGQYTWIFPFFGSFPYKGFYRHPAAQAESLWLRKKGYEVYIGKSDAFSTLGFFQDPLYSFMRRYPPIAIASLIIHEQTHATLYLKNQAQFNEEMAVFVGDEGGLLFVKEKFGDDSPQYNQALQWLHDQRAYDELLKSLYQALESMYKEEHDPMMRIQSKVRIISDFKERFSRSYDSLFETKNYRRLADIEINNAYLAANMTYTLELGLFYRLRAKCHDDLRETVSRLVEIKKTKELPQQFFNRTVGR